MDVVLNRSENYSNLDNFNNDIKCRVKLILFTLTLFFIPKICVQKNVELDLSVNYSKQVYGDDRENLQETKSYAVYGRGILHGLFCPRI